MGSDIQIQMDEGRGGEPGKGGCNITHSLLYPPNFIIRTLSCSLSPMQDPSFCCLPHPLSLSFCSSGRWAGPNLPFAITKVDMALHKPMPDTGAIVKIGQFKWGPMPLNQMELGNMYVGVMVGAIFFHSDYSLYVVSRPFAGRD